LAEVGTLQLEFEYLAHHTGKSQFRDKALKVFDALSDANDRQQNNKGLYPIYINTHTGSFNNPHITLGAMGDSFYEYLIKYWLMTGKVYDKYRRMYDESVKAIRQHLIKHSKPNKLTYIAELINGQLVHKFDHLVCFAGGMFALGSLDGHSDDMQLGKEITRTCHEMYNRTATGIASEIVKFEGDNDFIVPSDAKHYLLRPETAESFFVLWRLTKDPIYREWGWNIFTHINKYCRTQGGFSGIRDVTTTNVKHDDLQQSFFMAETLKYLYLLFSEDSLIPLDKYVFNTEAHPLQFSSDLNSCCASETCKYFCL
jgi:mannosyl-oligosaccharide alpha-1,2-mannosidase